MLRILLSKLWQMLPVLVLVSIGSFLLLEMVPGDPAVAVLGSDAEPADYERVREQLGLNEPLVERYTSWVGGVATGDLGNSIFPPNRPVAEMIQQRLPVTIEIALLTLVLSLAISVPVALRTAYRPGDTVDRIATTGAFASISVPSFLAGLLFVFFFVFNAGYVKAGIGVVGAVLVVHSVRVGWRRARSIPPGRLRTRSIVMSAAGTTIAVALTVLLVRYLPSFPRQGYARITEQGIWENLKSVALPVATLALAESAVFVRLLRSDLIETLGEDFILAARAKGMPVSRVMTRDALRPSMFSLITVISVTLGRIIGGSVIVESIFNLPGMGRLIIDAISTKDYPVVLASVLIIAVVYVVASALVDVAYAYLDPRIRRG